MLLPHVNVNITFPGMICSIEVRNLGKEGTRILGERVEVYTSNAENDRLVPVSKIPRMRYWERVIDSTY
jgi:hypothetical protein